MQESKTKTLYYPRKGLQIIARLIRFPTTAFNIGGLTESIHTQMGRDISTKYIRIREDIINLLNLNSALLQD